MFGGIVNFQEAAVYTHKIILVTRFFPAQADLLIHAGPGKHLPDFFRRGDDGRLIGELIADVDIERPVIAPELPAGGHVDLVKAHCVRIQDGGKLGGPGIELEVPLPVQADHFGRGIPFFFGSGRVRSRSVRIGNEVAAGRQLVYFKDGKGGVIACID